MTEQPDSQGILREQYKDDSNLSARARDGLAWTAYSIMTPERAKDTAPGEHQPIHATNADASETRPMNSVLLVLMSRIM